MTVHTEASARMRLMTFSNNICPQCGARLFAPARSEHVNERHVRHIWSCEACGYSFEAMVFYSSSKSPP
jgi:ribosomal protein L37AE/L43A